MKAGADDEAPLLEWEVRLGEAEPKRRYICLAAACFAGLAGLALTRQPLAGLVGFAAIIASTAEVFFPIKFRLDKEKARSKLALSVTEIEWAKVKRVVELPGSVRLLPLEKPSPLDEFRGVNLRFSGNREAVLATIRALRPETSATGEAEGDERLAGGTDGGGGSQSD